MLERIVLLLLEAASFSPFLYVFTVHQILGPVDAG